MKSAPFVYVYEIERDIVLNHNLGNQSLVRHFWDFTDPRLLAVQTSPTADHLSSAKNVEAQATDEVLLAPFVCLFVCFLVLPHSN
jgi:hypothetical protein